MVDNAIVMAVESVRTRASTNEVLVTFSCPLENAALVSGLMGKIGRQVGIAFADVEAVERHESDLGRPPAKRFGQQAQALKLSGFFLRAEVIAVLGQNGWVKLREILHVESMADADPREIVSWARFNNLEQFLPVEYRHAA